MHSENTPSTAGTRSAIVCAAIVTLAVLAAATTSVTAGQEPGDDVAAPRESAANENENAGQADQVSAREERRRRNAPDAGEPQPSEAQASETQASEVQPTDAAPIVLPGRAEAQIICRSYRPIGTRIQRRTCATAAEWAARDASSEQDAERFSREMREAASIAAPGGSTPGRTPL